MIDKDNDKLFNEEDVLDIEEAQDKNAFEDIQEELEENYLSIEENLLL